jgi:hypothetical protein
MKIKIFLIGLLVMFISAGYIFAATVKPSAKTASSKPAKIITVPAGSIIKTILAAPLTAPNITKGHSITCIVKEPFVYQSHIIIAIGTIVTGVVTDIDEVSGKLALRFNMMTTTTGQRIPISSTINVNRDLPVQFPIDVVLAQPMKYIEED